MCSTRVKQPPGRRSLRSQLSTGLSQLSRLPPSPAALSFQFSTQRRQQTKSDDVDGFLLNARVLRVRFSFCCRSLLLLLLLLPLRRFFIHSLLSHARFCWLPIGDALVVRGRAQLEGAGGGGGGGGRPRRRMRADDSQCGLRLRVLCVHCG